MPNSAQAMEETEEDHHDSDSLEQVHDLLTALPKNVREVVRLHYLVGLSYEEISSRMGIPVNSIGPLLSRARQKLRMKLQATEETPPTNVAS